MYRLQLTSYCVCYVHAYMRVYKYHIFFSAVYVLSSDVKCRKSSKHPTTPFHGPCRGTANQSEEKPLNMLESCTLGFSELTTVKLQKNVKFWPHIYRSDINHMNIPWITVLWTNLNYGGGFCPSRVALESDPAPCSGTTPLPRLIHVPTFKYNGRAGGKCGKIMENRWNIVHQGQNRIWWF